MSLVYFILSLKKIYFVFDLSEMKCKMKERKMCAFVPEML